MNNKINFSISVVPTSEININNEIKLLKSVLLYADDITVNSLTATMLNVIDSIKVDKRSVIEMVDIMEKVNPFIKMSDSNLSQEITNTINQVKAITPLLKKKYRNKYEILAVNKLKKTSPELEKRFDGVINIVNDILDSSGYTEILKANNFLKFEEYKSDVDNTDDIMKEYFNKVLESTTSLSNFPVFDAGTADLVRLYEQENEITKSKPYLEKNSHGAIVSNMFLNLPALDFISVEQLIELRSALEKYLINFRKAIYEFSEKVGCTQWDEEFQYQTNKLYVSKVLPQVEELEQRIKENSLVEKILKENYIDKTFWITLAGTVGMALTNCNNLMQGIASASFVGNTLRNTIKASYDYQNETNEIKNNTMYFYYKSNQEINKIIDKNSN